MDSIIRAAEAEGSEGERGRNRDRSTWWCDGCERMLTAQKAEQGMDTNNQVDDEGIR